MYCKYCGNKIDDDSIFCSHCGKKVVSFETKDLDNIIISSEENEAKDNISLPSFWKQMPCCNQGKYAIRYNVMPVMSLIKAGYDLQIFCADHDIPSSTITIDDKEEHFHRFFCRIDTPEGESVASAFDTSLQLHLDADYAEGDFDDESNDLLWQPTIVADNLLIGKENYHPKDSFGFMDDNLVKSRLKIFRKEYGKFLFFDTETTDLAYDLDVPTSSFSVWPRLLQLSWIITDEEGAVIKKENYIVSPDYEEEYWEISKEAMVVHGITESMAIQQGVNIKIVLSKFLDDLNQCNCVVAHNSKFDKGVVGAELYRLFKEDILSKKETICTMEGTTDLLKIPNPESDYKHYKYPKLQELYHFLFDKNFDNAHDALSDAQACLECFWELRKRGYYICNY